MTRQRLSNNNWFRGVVNSKTLTLISYLHESANNFWFYFEKELCVRKVKSFIKCWFPLWEVWEEWEVWYIFPIPPWRMLFSFSSSSLYSILPLFLLLSSSSYPLLITSNSSLPFLFFAFFFPPFLPMKWACEAGLSRGHSYTGQCILQWPCK